MDFATFIQTFGISALISGGVSLFFKERSEKNVKAYQAKIDAKLIEYRNKYDRDLINYKSGYEKELAELNFKLKSFGDKASLLNVKRAEVINQLYQKLVTLQSFMAHFSIGGNRWVAVGDDPDNPNQRSQEVADSFNDYYNFLAVNKLYFTPSLVSYLNKVSEDYSTAFGHLMNNEVIKSLNPDGNTLSLMNERVEIAKKSIIEEIPKTIELVEREFRGILGVE